MNPIILIPARMQATRLPNKPMREIAGSPMIVRVWYRAMDSGVGRVVVATDSEEIKNVVEKAGGEAVMTDPAHPSGSDRIYEALQAIDADGKHDVVINLQGDVPEIKPDYIRTVLVPLENPAVDITTLAAEITTEAERNDPSVVKAIVSGLSKHNGKAPAGEAFTFTRITPDGDVLYHHIGIYAYRRGALERFVKLPQSVNEQREKLEQLRALDNGMRIDVAVVGDVPHGVDTPAHLDAVSALAAPLEPRSWYRGA